VHDELANVNSLGRRQCDKHWFTRDDVAAPARLGALAPGCASARLAVIFDYLARRITELL
jgi:hypothetical protein